MINRYFDSEKAIEAILYIASKSPNPDIYHVVKILYFADRVHLDAYGRLITDDKYIAMKNGPVASGAYDLIKSVRDQREHCPSGGNIMHASATFGVQGNKLMAKRAVNDGLFSDSDLQCIDQAIEQYGSLSFSEINELSHDAVWQAANTNDEIPLEVIARSCTNPDILINYLNGGN